MTSIKVKFRASSLPGKEGVLFCQVIHGQVVRQVHTGYKVYPHEWDAAHAEIILPPDVGGERCAYLVSLKRMLDDNKHRLHTVIASLEHTGEVYTADDVVKAYLSVSSDADGFISFSREVISQMDRIGKQRSAERYTTIINSFIRFRSERDVLLDEVDSDLMMRYETFLKGTGACPNTTSYYMRGLRAIYNRAVAKNLTVQRSPFKYVYTGVDKTVKRAVPLTVIRKIRDLKLVPSSSVDFARDIFMFSFYTRGMSFVDMAFLKKKDLQNGFLVYRRQKTGQQLFIKWEKPMQEIIDKYDVHDTPYLLPIIKDAKADARRQYKNAAHLVNEKLKRLGEELGLSVSLTTYVARHAWASIAWSKNIPLTTISEAMGHDSEKTTRIYLASLDTSAVDKANSQILKLL